MLLLTYGGNDEQFIRRFNEDRKKEVFRELDAVSAQRWLEHHAKEGWRGRNYNGYNLPWVKLCVFRHVKVMDIINLSAIEHK